MALPGRTDVNRTGQLSEVNPTRGSFRYNTNHFPIQDFYLVQAGQRADGSYATAVKEKIFEDHADRQAAKCPMREG